MEHDVALQVLSQKETSSRCSHRSHEPQSPLYRRHVRLSSPAWTNSEYEDWDIEHISLYESSLDGDSDEILPSDYIIEKIISVWAPHSPLLSQAIYNNRERNVVIITKYGDEISSLLCILYVSLSYIES